MDGGNAPRLIERDSDLGDDSPISHDDHSDRDDEMRDCDGDSSDEGVNVHPPSLLSQSLALQRSRDSVSAVTANGGMDYHGGRSPSDHSADIPMGHHPHFPPNHPLGMLGSFMGVPGLQNMPNLQHGDVLEKLKMQVREMKVGLMDHPDFPVHTSFGATLPTPANTSFSLPSTLVNGMVGPQPQNLSQSQLSHSQSNGFPFTQPNAPNTKDANPGSNSSTSSEASNSSQQNNGWSFEEQFKQVRQLYEINDDPKRKEFLDDLFSFMQKRGTPINRLPIMAKSVLDLYELYNLVIARGGLVDVINKKLWQEIIKGLHLPSSITSAAFTLRTQYMKYLYPYECEKKNLSSPSELQAAIDGNRREGRRSSYGQFESMQNQLQMVQRSPVPSNLQQMSPLALVTHGASNPQSAHHRLMAPPLGQMPNLVSHEIEQRMMEYIKFFQTPKQEPRRSASPEISTRDALTALEMSRVALWQMYNNNTSPPASINTSPPGNEPQREALNLSESPPHISTKRERSDSNDRNTGDRSGEYAQQPPTKRIFPPSFHPALGLVNGNGFSAFKSRAEDREDMVESSQHNNSNGSCSNQHHDVDEKPSSMDMSPLTAGGEVDGEHLPVRATMPISAAVTSSSATGSNNNNIIVPTLFEISPECNSVNGEQQFFVKMKVNGVQYKGLLQADTTLSSSSPRATATATTKTTAMTENSNARKLTPPPTVRVSTDVSIHTPDEDDQQHDLHNSSGASSIDERTSSQAMISS